MPESEYKICHLTSSNSPGCISFATLSTSPRNSAHSTRQTETEIETEINQLEDSSVGSETIGGVVGAGILILIMCCAAVLIKKRKFSSSKSGASSGLTESGCEETSTWKYSSGSNDHARSECNTTPNSYYSNNDSYSNAHAYANTTRQAYPDVTGSAYPGTTTAVGYHYQPTSTSTPSKNNRHSQIIHDHQLLIKQQQQQMLAAATTPNKGHHNAQGSFSHFNTSHVPHQHAYSHSYSHTNPRDHNL